MSMESGQIQWGSPPDELHKVLAQVWACAFGRQKVAYLSGPITTGRVFIDWYRSKGRTVTEKTYGELHSADVMDVNARVLEKVAERLRTDNGLTIVNPGPLAVRSTRFWQGWTQHSYQHLWESLIRVHCDRVVLVDGWQFSAGSVSEYRCASDAGLAILDERLCAVSPQAASTLIGDAYDELEAAPEPALQKLAADLRGQAAA